MAQWERVNEVVRGPVGRREFLASCAVFATAARTADAAAATGWTYAVTGRIDTSALGVMLPHEHVLVDFVGADKVSSDRYDAEAVFRSVLPHLQGFKRAGGQSLAECTPAFLGRDVALLLRLSKASGVTLLTNTGYYGAAQDKYVPAHALDETPDRLAARWTAEFEHGIDGTGVRPGFIKTGIDAGPLSAIDRKLVRAAAICHRSTGLVICCHSGDGTAAFEAMDVLKDEGVSPEAFVWVHAQNEKVAARHVEAARRGAWVSLDGFRPARTDEYAGAVAGLVKAGQVGRILISQDAGWYRVGEPGGGEFTPYTALYERLVPALRQQGLTEAQVRTVIAANPARAFAVQRRVLAG